MNTLEKIRNTLRTAGALCDDCLSSSAAVRPRQQVNARCKDMVVSGEIARQTDHCPQCHRNKIVNRLLAGSAAVSNKSGATPNVATIVAEKVESERPWYWEGNVQEAIVRHLKKHGWEIRSSANTASRETGKDIVALKDAKELWVSVKGWPEKSSNTQARHWFAGALLDLVLYRGQHSNVLLAVGVPFGFSTYENLIPRVAWLRTNLPFEVFAVTKTGAVEVIK